MPNTNYRFFSGIALDIEGKYLFLNTFAFVFKEEYEIGQDLIGKTCIFLPRLLKINTSFE